MVKPMNSTRNPARRNRNIGTAKQGHGQNNRLVIPYDRENDRMFWERLTNFKATFREIGSHRLTFLVEKTRTESFHACTVDDITYLLDHVSYSDVRKINLIILRQPKRKEEILSRAWGRLVFYAEVGDYRGSAIILEAVEPAKSMLWRKSLDTEDQKELERLREDGHQITMTKRGHEIITSLESARATQLYRTVLHEIGHYVDSSQMSSAAWESKPSVEKETFAHRYADMMKDQLVKDRIIPFERKLIPENITKDGLRLSDFCEA